MKTLLHIIALLLLVNSAQAQNVFEASKTYKFTYQSAHLSLYSSFGTVKITTWNRPDIEIVVKVTGRAYKQQDAEEIIKTHDFVEKVAKDGSKVNLNAKLGPMFKNGIDGVSQDSTEANNGLNLQMDYEVHVPEQVGLHLHQSFGKIIFTNDFRGDLSVDMSRSTIEAEGLCGNSYIKYYHHDGNAKNRIGYLHRGVLKETMNFDIEKAGTLTIDGSNNCMLRQVEFLYLRNYHYGFTLQEAGSVYGAIKDGDIVRINKIRTMIDLGIGGCDTVILDMATTTANDYKISVSAKQTIIRNCKATDMLLETRKWNVTNNTSLHLNFNDDKYSRRTSGNDFPRTKFSITGPVLFE